MLTVCLYRIHADHNENLMCPVHNLGVFSPTETYVLCKCMALSEESCLLAERSPSPAISSDLCFVDLDTCVSLYTDMACQTGTCPET